MKALLVTLLAAAMPLTVASATTVKPAVDSRAAVYQQQLGKLVNALQQTTAVPGFSVAVVRQGKLLATATSGYADVAAQQPVNTDTVFRLASVSKLVGATMLAELVINKQLDPDAAIGRYYPELAQKYHAITIRQLLAHISGMPHYQQQDGDIYDSHYSSAIAAVATLKARDLMSRPGSEYRYSTHGYTLAGAVYEKITQQPLTGAVPQFVARWSGKATPLVENIHQLHKNSSKLYELEPGGARELAFGEMSYSAFGAGLSATATDLAYFGAAVLQKARQQPALQQLLFSATTLQDGSIVSDSRFQVGFGWRIAKDEQQRTVYHHAGSTPGARSILAVYPEQDLSIAILSNSSWVVSMDKLAFALASLYLDNAEPLPLTKLSYRIDNKHTTLSGALSCNSSFCQLSDNETDYAQWVNSFNAGKRAGIHWPVFAYSTTQGERLLLLNNIGIATLNGAQSHYTLDTGKHQTYSLTLFAGDNSINQ
ncbi:serine hydrolase domain-containing protein [Rheinheimera nanhaiensis]|uniref:Beta-lactamase n=1 Tax=Rheinheimera nanhaiensis E407-8 TaxID=562729 RepID=I1DZF7_9GAMM|nr:serine hydrolase domain-containing protein [Rheinheimera nanhaiensis]GAB59435.1 beta-lactamase [Rheinheimera nanhaiensis E407-8]